ncbi:MAG: glycosyltransferase, partial [Myxococcales bacterium]|nr:glycosyltransferase [Myxococcales bacterium]
MLLAFAVALTTAHALAALVITAYSASQLHLLVRSLRVPDPRVPPVPDELPAVTVQLPIRNEASVVADLLASVGRLDWPRDRLLVQVLDDSDDETTTICAAALEALERDGIRVEHVRRPVRQGFKAGALRDGLATAEGPYVAILDADFRPHPDFLRRTVPLLHAHPDVALVQARWGHINRDASVYTRAQALHLDAHFTVEQRARSHRPLLMGFNGTAGVWRREAIDAAGGWSSDTLTEDLDLAFRAQLGGWNVLYVDAVEAPAELPADVRAIRTQQHRWMKGGAQVARKLLGALWRSDTPLLGKVQGTVHLLGGAVFLAVVVLLLATPALGPLQVAVPQLATWTRPALTGLSTALVVLLAFYGTTAVRRDGPAGMLRLARDFLPFLSLSTGLAVHDSVAVLEGWAGQESPFVRTPKVGSAGIARYTAAGAGPIVIGELALAAWGLLGLLWALSTGNVVLAAFLASQTLGCAAVAL